MNNIKIKIKKNIIFLWVIIVAGITACTDPFANQTFFDNTGDDTELTCAAFLSKNPDKYSEFIAFLKYAGFYNALNDSKTIVTLFAPDNNSMISFYKSKGVSKADELDYNYARNLAKVHLMSGSITEDEFMQSVDDGSMSNATFFGSTMALGYGYINNDVDDALLSNAKIQDTLSIYINNQASVLEMAHQTANGMVYTIGGVLRPIIETVADKIHDYQIYKIFYEAMEKTGWSNKLSVQNDTIQNEDGSTSVMNYSYTVFATPDSIYKLNKINSFSDLSATLGAGSDYNSEDNALNHYVAYHILNGKYDKKALTSVFESDQVNLFDTSDKNQVIQVQNVNDIPFINKTIKFIRTNIQCSNGLLHKIDGIMPVFKPEKRTVIWDFCNTSEIVSIVNSYGIGMKSVSNLFYINPNSTEYSIDISNLQLTGKYGVASGFKYVSTKSGKSPYMFYKCKYKSATEQTQNEYGAYMNNLLIVQVGYNGSIEMTTPTLIAGKYKVELFYGGKSKLYSLYEQGSLTKFSIDDEYMRKVYIWKGWPKTEIYSSSVIFDEVEFKTTTSHTFKSLLMDSRAGSNNNYMQLWDYVKFTPIQD